MSAIVFCMRCGGRHLVAQCYLNRQKSDAPLETPSHNGAWRGSLPVRVIPTGVMGSDLDASWQDKGRLGRLKQARMRGQAKGGRRKPLDKNPSPSTECLRGGRESGSRRIRPRPLPQTELQLLAAGPNPSTGGKQ